MESCLACFLASCVLLCHAAALIWIWFAARPRFFNIVGRALVAAMWPRGREGRGHTAAKHLDLVYTQPLNTRQKFKILDKDLKY